MGIMKRMAAEMEVPVVTNIDFGADEYDSELYWWAEQDQDNDWINAELTDDEKARAEIEQYRQHGYI